MIQKVVGSASAAASAARAPEPPDPDKPPKVSVNPDVSYIGRERIDLKMPDADAKIASTLALYKLEGKTIQVTIPRDSKTGDVTKILGSLAAKNVAGFEISSPDRDRKDTKLNFVTASGAGKLPDCTMAVMVNKEKFTSSWTIKGGGAMKYQKGMAGPDMTSTINGVSKPIAACETNVLVVSGHESVEWALTFDIAQLVSAANPPLKTNKFLLPRETPVPGQAIKL